MAGNATLARRRTSCHDKNKLDLWINLDFHWITLFLSDLAPGYKSGNGMGVVFHCILNQKNCNISTHTQTCWHSGFTLLHWPTYSMVSWPMTLSHRSPLVQHILRLQRNPALLLVPGKSQLELNQKYCNIVSMKAHHCTGQNYNL